MPVSLIRCNLIDSLCRRLGIKGTVVTSRLATQPTSKLQVGGHDGHLHTHRLGIGGREALHQRGHKHNVSLLVEVLAFRHIHLADEHKVLAQMLW